MHLIRQKAVRNIQDGWIKGVRGRYGAGRDIERNMEMNMDAIDELYSEEPIAP
jgi:hypothetical protein